MKQNKKKKKVWKNPWEWDIDRFIENGENEVMKGQISLEDTEKEN